MFQASRAEFQGLDTENEPNEMQQNEPIQEIEDWDKQIGGMKKQQREEKKRQDWFRRRIELKESRYQEIEDKERDVHGSIQVEEIEENIRKIRNNIK